jgi:hypothetical protein
MNWIYILLRTFPFWAIPIGLVLVYTGIIQRRKKKYLLLGLLFIGTAIFFLSSQGHFTAVPWAHELLFGDKEQRMPASEF